MISEIQWGSFYEVKNKMSKKSGVKLEHLRSRISYLGSPCHCIGVSTGKSYTMQMQCNNAKEMPDWFTLLST